MAVVIRMQRAGAKNAPFFRVVVADSKRARDGRFLEKVGYYNPLPSPADVKFDAERVKYWLDRGAKPSEAVSVLLKKSAAASAPVEASQA
jgi:small subunit ribosomal protein S16